MKKQIFIALALVTFGLVAAQVREKGTVELVPQIGLAYSNYYDGEAGELNKDISSFTFGVGGDIFFSDRWSLHTGLFKQIMGTKIKNTTIEEELRYITFPLNANWHFGSTRKWNLNFGPNIGFLTSAETTNGITKLNIKSEVESNQIGFNLGIGYKIEVSDNFSFLIDYQSNTGLTEIAKQYAIKNSFWSFNFGAVLKL